MMEEEEQLSVDQLLDEVNHRSTHVPRQQQQQHRSGAILEMHASSGDMDGMDGGGELAEDFGKLVGISRSNTRG
jgi:hypothetical protein